MTAVVDEGLGPVPAPPRCGPDDVEPFHGMGTTALRRLVACDPATFADLHWARTPLLSRADALPGGFGDLLDADAVDELVSQRALRTPFLRVARDGETLPSGRFTAPGGVGAGVADQLSDDKLVALFAGGATMVLQGLHRSWSPIIAFCQQLAAELGHPVQANAYVTPPQSRGFDDHYDVHDVFVLQIEGEKHWRIHAPVLPAPLRDQPWTDRTAEVHRAAREDPVIDAVLRPGDCLYLPRGYLHAATALGGVSTHLTLGVHSWTRHALAAELTAAVLAELASQEEVRGSLPLGVGFDDGHDVRDDLALVRERIALALGKVEDGAVADRMRARARAAQRAAPVGPLAQLRAAAALEDHTLIKLRDHLDAAVDRTDGVTTLRSRGNPMPLHADEADRLEPLLAGRGVAAGTVGTDLARRLIEAGLVVTA